MPSFRPIDRPRANYASPRRKPWHARRKRDGIEHSLGYHSTREDAERVEARFDAEWPPRGGQRR